MRPMKFVSGILLFLTAAAAVQFLAPKGCSTIAPGYSDEQALPQPFPHVGYWLTPTRGYVWDRDHGTYAGMMDAWRRAGADGILITDHDLEGAIRKAELSSGYGMRMTGGADHANLAELDRWLSDPRFSSAYDIIYFDEILLAWTYDGSVPKPFTAQLETRVERALDTLLLLCERFDKRLGVAAFGIGGAPRFDRFMRMLVDAERRRVASGPAVESTPFTDRIILFAGAGYFQVGDPEYLTYTDSVSAWADRTGFDRAHIIPWMAPSCMTPDAGGGRTVAACRPDWTLNQILRLAEQGFGGICFYLANGLDEEHLDRLLLGLWATGNLRLASFPRPATYGDLRALLEDESSLEPLVRSLRTVGIPKHLPEWEWK